MSRLRSALHPLCIVLLLLAFAGCGGLKIGIGRRPSHADILLCQKFLSVSDGRALEILWQEFDEVVTDGVHNGDTCPILVLYPLQQGHRDGSISDADFAKKLFKFYRAKYEQTLNGHKKDAKERLVAAGINEDWM